MTSHVNTTSSAVSGFPSLHRSPFRNLNVHVFSSGSTFQLSASQGVTSCLAMSKFRKPANRNRVISVEEDSFAVRGLKVFGSPKVAITRRPPRCPGSHLATSGGSGSGPCAVDPVDSLDFFPQPATTRPRSPRTDRHLQIITGRNLTADHPPASAKQPRLQRVDVVMAASPDD